MAESIQFRRPVRITLLAIGSRGDVQPLVVVAQALKAAGHEVRLLAGRNFEPWLQQMGFDVVPAQIDVFELMQSRSGADWVKHGNNPRRQLQMMKTLVNEYGRRVAAEVHEACEGAQLVISSALSDVFASSIVEKLGSRQISLVLQPALVATRDGRSTMNALRPNSLSHLNYWLGKWVIEGFMWRLFGDLTNDYRRSALGLPAIDRKGYLARRSQMLILQAYSTAVVPRPDDLPPNIHTTGYLHLDAETQWDPPAGLQEFIAAGRPPVFVGFGSMTGGNPEETTALVVNAARICGHRVVLQSGWAGLGPGALPEGICQVGDMPHDWLLPRMAAAVHHGGAGTTAASLRAGLPTVIVPHLADQQFWGQRVRALGLGPTPIRRDRLTASNLAAAIDQAVSDTAMRERCRIMGQTLQSEDGCRNALEKIREYLET